MEKAKVVIVGAGPAGIATAVEAKEAGIAPVMVLEKKGHACDTIVSLYHEGKRVDPVYRKVKIASIGKLSFDTETREAFLKRIKRIVAEYELDIRYWNEVQKVVAHEDRFHIQTSGGLEIAAPIVVIAIGVFGKPIKPSYAIPKEVRDKVYFSLPKEPPKDQKILVVGGGDSAAEYACFLSCDNEVILSYRKPEFFRINETNLCNLKDRTCEGNITLKMSSDIEALEQDGDRVKARFQGEGELCFDAIYYCLGGSTPQTFLEGIGVTCDGRKPQVDEHGETNIPRIFLAGDLVANKGSIMAAFNSGRRTVDGIVKRYKELL